MASPGPHVEFDVPSSMGDATDSAADTAESRASHLETTAAKLLSLMDIPNDMLTSFIAFYHKYTGTGGNLSDLSNLDIRMATAQPFTIDRRRKSNARRMSALSQQEQSEIIASDARPILTLKQFVAEMREEFWLFNDDEVNGPGKKKIKNSSPSWLNTLEGPWSKSLKEIEGRYGAAVMSYFSFLQHIMAVNAVVFLLMLLIIVPHYVLLPASQSSVTSSADVLSCSARYNSSIQDMTERSEWFDYPVYIFTGTGVMERAFFYGMLEPYYDVWILGKRSLFDMSLMTSIVPLICFFVSLLLITARTSQYLSSTIRASKHAQSTRYTIQVLSSWKHSIIDPKGCQLQKALTKNKLLNMLSKDDRHKKSRARKFVEGILLIIARIVASIMILALLAISGVLVWVVQIFSDESLSNSDGTNQAMDLALSFLPSFTLTAIYLVARALFDLTMRLESYSQEVALVISIVRAAVLRVASLVLLFATFFSDSWTCPDVSSESNQTLVTATSSSNDMTLTSTNRVCGNCRAAADKQQTYCWESYVGQQLYKLVIVDFLMVFVNVFLIETPWRLVHNRFKDSVFIVRKIGLPEFDIPKFVLDVAYSQTLCWISMLFCPFVPAITFITTVVRFYSQKFSVERNFKITEGFSSSSEVRVVFLLLLCPFLIFSLTIILICIIFLPPSQGCGPFRELSDNGQMITAISKALKDYPTAKEVLNVLTDLKFLMALIVLISILIYCFKAISQGTDKLIELLEESRGRMINDKRALWAKINSKMKQAADQLEDRPPPRGGNGTGFVGIGSTSSSAAVSRTVAAGADMSPSQVHYGNSVAEAHPPPQLIADGVGKSASNMSHLLQYPLASSNPAWRNDSPVLRPAKPASTANKADNFAAPSGGSRRWPSSDVPTAIAVTPLSPSLGGQSLSGLGQVAHPLPSAATASTLFDSLSGGRSDWESSMAGATMSQPFASDQRRQIVAAGGIDGVEAMELVAPSTFRPHHPEPSEATQPAQTRQVAGGGRLPRRKADFY